MSRRNKSMFSEKELLFVQHYQGDQTKAAKAAGYARPGEVASRLMKRPHIKKAVDDKLAKAANVNAVEFGKRVQVTRNDIINGLAEEARTAESDSARVSAWRGLADIYRLTQPPGKTSN